MFVYTCSFVRARLLSMILHGLTYAELYTYTSVEAIVLGCVNPHLDLGDLNKSNRQRAPRRGLDVSLVLRRHFGASRVTLR